MNITMMMREHRYEYRITNIRECVIFSEAIDNLLEVNGYKFFKESKKHKQYKRWKEIINMINSNEHLTREGLEKIAELKPKINEGHGGRTKDEYLEDID